MATLQAASQWTSVCYHQYNGGPGAGCWTISYTSTEPTRPTQTNNQGSFHPQQHRSYDRQNQNHPTEPTNRSWDHRENHVPQLFTVVSEWPSFIVLSTRSSSAPIDRLTLWWSELDNIYLVLQKLCEKQGHLQPEDGPIGFVQRISMQPLTMPPSAEAEVEVAMQLNNHYLALPHQPQNPTVIPRVLWLLPTFCERLLINCTTIVWAH